jgi:cobalt/nickel transport protein
MSRNRPATLRRARHFVNWLLIAAVVLLAVMPLVLRAGSAFSGSDDAATREIIAINPGARPWLTPLWTPPGPEVESFLFALQAALGAGFIGYFFGYKRGRSDRDCATSCETDRTASQDEVHEPTERD